MSSHSHAHGGAAVQEEHGHSPFLQHHFTEMSQQLDASKIGMWLFLVTEILLFGGLFVGFGIMQSRFPEAFYEAHHHLDRSLGALNTVVLLVSSFTMVMAVHSAQTSQKKKLIVYLILTLLCAGIFLGVKYFEYSHKIHDGLLPGKFYSHKADSVAPTALEAGQATARGQMIFFSFYFMMTGLHGIHILGGMAVIGWVLVRAIRGDFSAGYYTPVDLVGLYWHLVDLIWIYLFPLLYLIS
ncbi:MAG: cytochrome c oxidase subunit 3 family protein [Bryobacteraceae bacterium]|nr:cytochrome c oxidase subunit 3 family protein [Bryobacteraceae bacterium]